MIISIVLVVSMCMASLSCFQLNVALKVYSDAKARMAAESEINRALFLFVEDDPHFGKDGNPDTYPDQYTGASAKIIFSPSGTQPYSTYNYYNTKDAVGWNGRKVPAESIHLIATGTSGASRRSIEMIVKKGIFPYALATSSKIQSVNAPLWTEGVKDTKSLLADVKDRPGNVNSNFSSGGNAIEAPKNCYVTGAVTAPGEIDIKQPSIVIGGIKPGSPSIELPFITTAALDPKDQVGVIDITSSTLSAITLDSLHRTTGKLTVYGDLKLDNGLLFTEDDLLVTGKVTGSGALISKGKITLQQTSDLAASNQLAIVADKDITIAGQNSYLQGLVYTHGNFYGENFTLVGNLIAQSSDESAGKAVLNNVKIINSEQTTNQTINSPAHAGEAGGNLWKSNVNPEWDHLYEHFDIQWSGDSISSQTALNNALHEASLDFNASTAAALDDAAAPGKMDFHTVCVNCGCVYDHPKVNSMTELYNQIQSEGGQGFILSVTGTAGTGTPVDPKDLDIMKIIKGLLKHLKHNLDIMGPGNGTLSGFTVVTDLRLNKYITNVRPTRITFQGELP
jgi:hypothetical protein